MADSNHLTITRKEKLKTVLAIVASYFLLNLPYAVNLLAEYGVQLKTATRQAKVQFLSDLSPIIVWPCQGLTDALGTGLM